MIMNHDIYSPLSRGHGHLNLKDGCWCSNAMVCPAICQQSMPRSANHTTLMDMLTMVGTTNIQFPLVESNIIENSISQLGELNLDNFSTELLVLIETSMQDTQE